MPFLNGRCLYPLGWDKNNLTQLTGVCLSKINLKVCLSCPLSGEGFKPAGREAVPKSPMKGQERDGGEETGPLGLDDRRVRGLC